MRQHQRAGITEVLTYRVVHSSSSRSLAMPAARILGRRTDEFRSGLRYS